MQQNKTRPLSAAQMQSPLVGRDGVAASRVWLPDGPWLYVGQFLLERFAHLNKEQLLARIQKGDMVDATGRAVHFYTPYQAGQWLWYYREAPDEVAIPFALPILYADDYLIAVDKPHYLPSIPSGQYLRHTAVTRLRKKFNNYDITPLHRLDRETAGVMLFCVQPRYRGQYQALFQNQAVQKDYEAVAPIPPGQQFPLQLQSRLQNVPGQFLMQTVSGTANSDTYIQLLGSVPSQTSEPWGHYLLQPATGRKHQLRVHLQSLGAPIINDSLYGGTTLKLGAQGFNTPLQLLARKIAFIDPVTHEYREFMSQRALAALPPKQAKAP